MDLCLFVLELHALGKTRYLFVLNLFCLTYLTYSRHLNVCVLRYKGRLHSLCYCALVEDYYLFVVFFCLLCNAALCMEELSERPSRDLRGTRRPRSPLADGRRLLVFWFLNIKYKWFTFWEGLLCRDPRILTEDDCVVFLDMRHLSAEYLFKNKPMLFVVKPYPPSSHGSRRWSFSFFNKDVVLLLKYEVYHVLGLKPNTNVFLLFQVLGQKPSPHICLISSL